MDIREDKAWLLRSRFNPSPVSGVLDVRDGQISFVLDEAAAETQLEWVESALATDGLRDRLGAGEEVVVFRCDLADCHVTWPITGGGSTMVVGTPDRRWVITPDIPSGGAVMQTLGAISGRSRARQWKMALAAIDV